MGLTSEIVRETNHETVARGNDRPEVVNARIRLWLAHAINSRRLNDQGQYADGGKVEHYFFNNYAVARDRRDALLEAFPYAMVFLEGEASNNVERMSSSRWGDYSAERQEYLDWKSRWWFLRIFSRCPPVTVYNPGTDPLNLAS